MKYFTLLLVPVFLFSCSGSKMLLKSLNKYQAPMDYLHDSKITNCDKSESLFLFDIDSSVLDSVTSVSKINHKVLPFLFFNYEELNLAVQLGQSSLKTNYPDFFKESFRVESQRTGCYSLADNPSGAEYSLEIKYDTCIIKSKYQQNSTILFLLLAYSVSTRELGFPAEANLALHVRFKKGDDLVFEKKYSIDRIQPFLNNQSVNVNNLRSDFVNNMAESLSLGTKDCIEQIINDINHVIKKK